MSANPWVYDQVQKISGSKRSQQHLIPHLKRTDNKIVLDIGAGTGIHRSLISEKARYLWLDNDPRKLNGFQPRQKLSDTILLGDATQLGLHNNSIDVALCSAVSHHLSDQQLTNLFSELARIVREKLIFLDAVDDPTLFSSRLLWKYDRGSWPRPATVLIATLQTQFDIEHIEQYKVYHQYLLCIARPKQDLKAHD